MHSTSRPRPSTDETYQSSQITTKYYAASTSTMKDKCLTPTAEATPAELCDRDFTKRLCATKDPNFEVTLLTRARHIGSCRHASDSVCYLYLSLQGICLARKCDSTHRLHHCKLAKHSPSRIRYVHMRMHCHLSAIVLLSSLSVCPEVDYMSMYTDNRACMFAGE